MFVLVSKRIYGCSAMFWTVSLGICAIRASIRSELQGGLSVSDRERPVFTGVNGTTILALDGADGLPTVRFTGVADAQLTSDVREYLAVYGCVRALAAAIVAVTVAVGDTT